jgi:hypothetical protein
MKVEKKRSDSKLGHKGSQISLFQRRTASISEKIPAKKK